ncbi:phosphonate metabolism protein, PhnP [Pseudomonas syringae pv. actinidiae ICMP 19070]|nr:phosphonate metabolism protein, PhnP [Pseudomonas syringae pv. actinidiae ICMP 19070]
MDAWLMEPPQRLPGHVLIGRDGMTL